MTSQQLLETQSLGKDFGEIRAVVGVSLRVSAGEILALLGPNGAGKTTTIRMLASILRPTSGTARVAGYDVVGQSSMVRRSVGLLTEHHGLYTRMSALEYLSFFGRLYGIPDEECARRGRRLLEMLGLAADAGRLLGEFSRGMRQKLALARCLIHDPSVMLFDEPTSGLDPTSARLVRENIRNLRTNHRAIMVCTHNLAEAEELADRIAIIRRGSIVAHGTVQELRRRWLGDPVMELRLARPLDGAARHLPPGLSDVQEGGDWIRYRTVNPRETNPLVIRSMAEAGVEVMSLAEVQRNLEEIYLRVMDIEPSEWGAGDG